MNRVALTASGPLPAYRARLAAGELATDPAQALAAERLQSLWTALRGYDPHPAEDGSFLVRLFGRRPADDIPEGRPHGLYLVGDVGRGKSMLMDLFFATADVPRKRRIHFHQFMQEAHARIHAWRSETPGADPIPPLADQIAAEAALLCFDEMQVNDVADAMILGRLFEALFARGVVVVATSNTRPGDLFAGQPGRDAFLPFIALIEANLDVLVLDGARDWRRQGLHGAGTWHVPADTRADHALDEAFTTLTGGAPATSARLTIMGRTLTVPLAAAGVARFGFDALCGQPLGPGDYLALATHYHALVLDGVPRLSPENYDTARRFVTLVDALYDHRTKLVASADAMPDQLYERGEGARAFERTASRLEEMRTEAYWALAHLT
ncbi:MAG: cell division protein ZapE [Pseudomonadota bacterium]|nr:cell division protein ZapE [Pseudomonadota bacterium]